MATPTVITKKLCDQTSTFEGVLQDHQQLPFCCPHEGCGKRFAERSRLSAHNRAHLPRSFPCPFSGCDKSFAMSSNRNRHVTKHENENRKRFVCSVDSCTAAFKRRTQLRIHMVVHTKEKNYSCKYENCGRAFTQLGSLRTHERRHSGIKPHICRVSGCTSTFFTSTELREHLKTHANERSYICKTEGCTARFNTSGTLLIHSRIHSGERPFSCTLPGCTSRFVSSGHLQVHKRMHAGLCPFKCSLDGCSAAFYTSSALKTHMGVHTSERKYKCTKEGCDSAHKYLSGLKKHTFFNHTKEGQFRRKREEARVRKVLEKAGLSFTDQHTVDFMCTGPDRDGDRAFIDFLVEVRDPAGKLVGFVFLEVDERQHEWYTVQCEVRRMADVQLSLALAENTFPIMFIRYNPNAYRVDGKAVRLTKEEREKRLVDYLRSVSFSQPFAVTYMYYDVLEGVPAVIDDPSYNESFKAALGDVIF
jgi:C2H2 type zinc finger protein